MVDEIDEFVGKCSKCPNPLVFPTAFCPWERLRHVSKAIACSRSLYSIVSKETYYSVKRDLLQCQKRPTTVSKETY